MANEAFAWVKIDRLVKDAGCSPTDGHSLCYEYSLDDGGEADYGLPDRPGPALAASPPPHR